MNMTKHKAHGQRVKAAIRNTGQTVSAWARKHDLGISLIQQICRGAMAGYKYDEAIAQGTKVSLHWLETGENPPRWFDPEKVKKDEKLGGLFKPDEWWSLAEIMAKRFMNDPGIAPASAYRGAVGSMPKERRRVWSQNLWHQLKPLVIQKLKEIKSPDSPEPQTIVKEVPKEVVITVKDLSDFKTWELREEIAKRQEEALAQRLEDRIIGRLTTEIVDTIKSIQPLRVEVNGNGHSEPEPEPEPEPEKPKLPRVLLVGLKPIQFQKLQGEFKGLFDLRDFGFQTSPGQMASKGPSCDFIICSRFVSHAHEETAKKIQDVQYYMVKGGVTMIKNKLYEILESVTAGAA